MISQDDCIQPTSDIDAIITKLLQFSHLQEIKVLPLTVDEISTLIRAAIDVIMSQPVLLELNTPIKVCGTS